MELHWDREKELNSVFSKLANLVISRLIKCSEWRLFINSSKTGLKAVFINSGRPNTVKSRPMKKILVAGKLRSFLDSAP